MVNNVVVHGDVDGDNNVMLSAKQFEQLLNLLDVQKEEDFELDSLFSGMVVRNSVTVIDDSG